MKSFALKPWQVSISLHLFFVSIFILLTLVRPYHRTLYEVPIYVKEPESVQQILEVKEKPKVVLKSVNQSKTTPVTKAREVFGVSRHSYTDSTGEGVDVSAKMGNTVAKEADKEKLSSTDLDSLPTPTEEYLVSEMPSLVTEFKPAYPPEAKEKQIEGAVTMNILIDEKGHVRQATILDGPDIFRATALEAIRHFIFRPAKVDGKAVAVKIRYILRFKLEY